MNRDFWQELRIQLGFEPKTLSNSLTTKPLGPLAEELKTKYTIQALAHYMTKFYVICNQI